MQVGVCFLLDGEENCALTGLNAQDENHGENRKLKQEEFLKADYIFLRSVEHPKSAAES